MAVITKIVGRRSYAYLSVREGKRVRHRYIGPVGDPAVEKILSSLRETTSVPERFRYLFWDARIEDIHLKRNARYIIEKVLELGSLDAVNWLQDMFTAHQIKAVLADSRGLSNKSRIFWSLWFGLENI
jgi:hypothetical protein